MLEKEYLKVKLFHIPEIKHAHAPTYTHIIMSVFNRVSCLEGRMTQNCEGKGRGSSQEAGKLVHSDLAQGWMRVFASA